MPKQQQPTPTPHPGRPTDYPGKRRRSLTLSAEAWAIALRLGDGNASDGIEQALRQADSASGASAGAQHSRKPMRDMTTVL